MTECCLHQCNGSQPKSFRGPRYNLVVMIHRHFKISHNVTSKSIVWHSKCYSWGSSLESRRFCVGKRFWKWLCFTQESAILKVERCWHEWPTVGRGWVREREKLLLPYYNCKIIWYGEMTSRHSDPIPTNIFLLWNISYITSHTPALQATEEETNFTSVLCYMLEWMAQRSLPEAERHFRTTT